MAISKQITPIDEILSGDALAALRAGYAADPASLASFPAAKFNGLYPPGEAVFNTIGERFYDHGSPARPPNGPLQQKDRERCVISIFAATGQVQVLAIHIYWGLMLGIEPGEIGEMLLLAGVYSGIHHYTTGLGILEKTLCVLKHLAGEGNVVPLQIAGELMKAFQP